MSRIDNNYFTYRQTPTTENGTGTLVDIKGQTIKWNQLVYNGNFTSTDGWAGQSGNPTLSVADNSITVTMTSGSPSVFNPAIKPSSLYPFVANHKYLFSFDLKATKAGVCLYYRSNAFGGGLNFFPVLQSANTWTSYKNIVTATNTEDFVGYFGLSYGSDSGITVGDSFSLRNLMMFDLTALGIADKTNEEILQWFEDYFPLNYYPYNSGSLIPFMGNGIKTVGKNLLSYSGENLPYNASGVSITREDNIYKVVASNPSGYPFARISTIHYLPKGQYTVTMLGAESSSTGIAWRLIERNPVKIFVDTSATTTTFTLNEDAHDVYFEITIDASKLTTGTWDVRFQLNIGTPSDYEPYTSSTLSLPISTYFPTGMKSAGNVYDEWTPSKATTRVGGILTLDGTNTWIRNYARTNGDLVVYLRGDWKSYPNTEVADITATVPVTLANRQWSGTTTSLAINVSGELCIAIEGKTTVSEVNAYLQSNPIYLTYALATPIETAISPELDLTFNIDKGGTEELLPSSLMNGSVDLGSLTWTLYGANNHEFTADLPNMKVGTLNAITALDITVVGNYAQWVAQRPNNSLYKDTNGKLHLRLNPYTTVAELTSALQGVYLWYETTDSTPTTTPILCDILYRGLIPVSVTVYPLGAGTVEGAGQYRYGETVTLVAESSDGIYRFLRYEDENGDTLSTDSTYSFIAGE